MSPPQTHSFSSIRTSIYDYNKHEVRTEYGIDLDDWWRHPYTALKSRLYLELSAVVVYLLERTAVRPNHVTLTYAMSGLAGAALMARGSDRAVWAALFLFFFKGVLDWSDGHLARLTGRYSRVGAILDTWGALVNSFGFVTGLGLYLFTRTGDSTYVYLMATILVARAIDVRHFAYLKVMNEIIEGRTPAVSGDRTKLDPGASKKALGVQNNSTAAVVGGFVLRFLDDRARSVDFVCLLVALELWAGRVWVTPYVYMLYAAKYIMIFAAGFYLVYFKDMSGQLANIVADLKNANADANKL